MLGSAVIQWGLRWLPQPPAFPRRRERRQAERSWGPTGAQGGEAHASDRERAGEGGDPRAETGAQRSRRLRRRERESKRGEVGGPGGGGSRRTTEAGGGEMKPRGEEARERGEEDKLMANIWTEGPRETRPTVEERWRSPSTEVEMGTQEDSRGQGKTGKGGGRGAN